MNEKNAACIDDVLKSLSESAAKRKMLILDLGFGDGSKIDFFLKSNFKVIAVDKSREVVRKTSKRFCHENVKFVVGDMSDIEFKPGSFDLIISVAVLNFLSKSNAKKVILRMREWTKTGGYNAVSVYRSAEGPGNKNQGCTFSNGELAASYPDWRIEYHRGLSFIDTKHGEAHTHNVSEMMARKIFKS